MSVKSLHRDFIHFLFPASLVLCPCDCVSLFNFWIYLSSPSLYHNIFLSSFVRKISLLWNSQFVRVTRRIVCLPHSTNVFVCSHLNDAVSSNKFPCEFHICSTAFTKWCNIFVWRVVFFWFFSAAIFIMLIFIKTIRFVICFSRYVLSLLQRVFSLPDKR